MPAFIVRDRGKHLLSWVLHVQLCSSYGSEAEGSDSGLLEEREFRHPVSLCYSFLRVELLLVKFIPWKGGRVPVLSERLVEGFEHPVVRNSPIPWKYVDVR